MFHEVQSTLKSRTSKYSKKVGHQSIKIYRSRFDE